MAGTGTGPAAVVMSEPLIDDDGVTKASLGIAKRPYVNIVIAIIAMALIASSSSKATFGCSFEIDASVGSLKPGAEGLDQTEAPAPAPAPSGGDDDAGGSTPSTPATTCASLVSSGGSIEEQYQACTGPGASGVCEYWYDHQAVTSQPSGSCPTPGSKAGCGCTLSAKFALAQKLDYSLDLKLSKGQFCIDCSCTGDSCWGGEKPTPGKCWGGTSSKLANNAQGGGFGGLPVAKDLLFDSSTCETISDLVSNADAGAAGGGGGAAGDDATGGGSATAPSSGSAIPSWFGLVFKLIVILPAILLALVAV
eukprot:g4311.t1